MAEYQATTSVFLEDQTMTIWPIHNKFKVIFYNVQENILKLKA